jgi:ABC-2 type transport system permease protein
VTALVSAELLKLRTTRTAIGFLIATVLLTLLFQGVTFATEDIRTADDLRQTIAGAGMAALLLLILGIVATTGEYRHRTITGSLLVTPDRRRLLLSKTLAYMLTGAFLGLVAMIVAIGVGLIWLGIRDQPTDLISAGDYAVMALRGIAATAISGAIGVAIGAIVRNQVLAVVGLLVYLFVVEGLVSLVSDDVYDFMIGQTQASLLGTGQVGDEWLAPGIAGLVYLGWAVLLLVIGALLEERRDVT